MYILDIHAYLNLRLVWKNFFQMLYRVMEATKREYQVILGTILGGSSIICPKKGKHCYLSMRDKRAKWLEFKAFQLANFASQEPFTIEKTNRWHSLAHPIFDEFRAKFYHNNKRYLDIENLTFWDIGLSIWFGDAGIFKNGQVILNTHVWGCKGTETLAKYFELCQWPAEIFMDRTYYRLRLNREASVHFMNTIQPHLPFPLTNSQ
jgi:hypothetical protein